MEEDAKTKKRLDLVVDHTRVEAEAASDRAWAAARASREVRAALRAAAAVAADAEAVGAASARAAAGEAAAVAPAPTAEVCEAEAGWTAQEAGAIA